MVMENKKRQKQNKEDRASTLESLIKSDNDDAVSTYESLNWTGTFWDYIAMIEQNPSIARNSYQRLYDMVMSHGTEEFTYCKRKHIKYKFSFKFKTLLMGIRFKFFLKFIANNELVKI